MRRDERGQNLVETALVLPLLLLLMAGVLDVGRAFYSYMSITNAAREGARAGARMPCYTDDAAQRAVYAQRIIDAVQGEVDGAVVAAGDLVIAISPSPAGGCQDPGDPVEVTVKLPYSMILAGITKIGDFDMSSSTSMSRVGKAP